MLVADFAILAPVPAEHLRSWLQSGKPDEFVAFGTMKFELFRKINAMRDGQNVRVLIYPSHENLPGKDTFKVTHLGWYDGHIEPPNGTHPNGAGNRPLSTFDHAPDNKGHWAAFWHVRKLESLAVDKQVTIGKIEGYKGGWRKNAPPRGPELVKLPPIYNRELTDDQA